MDAVRSHSLAFSLLLSSTGDGGGLRPAARPRFFCWITLFSWTPSRTTISNVTHGDEHHMLNTRFINAALPAKRDYLISP